VNYAVRVAQPFPLADLPRLYAWSVTFRHQVMDDFAPQTQDDFVEDYMSLMERGALTWAVYRDHEDGMSELGGFIAATTANSVAVDLMVLFKREFFNKHTSAPAMTEAMGEIFDLFPSVLKINLKLFADNHQLARLAQHELGFQREGTIRAATIRRGQPIDIRLLGITRAEFEQCRSPYSSPSQPQQLEPSAEPCKTEAATPQLQQSAF